MESQVCDVSIEMVRVKEEPDWERSEEYEFTDYEEKPMCVKEEPSWSDDAGSSNEGVDLYDDHKVKDELDLGPEGVQTPGGPSAEIPVSVKEEPAASDSAGSCSESAEPPDRLMKEIMLTPLFMVQPGMAYVVNGSNPAVNPESNRNLISCDICDKQFTWARNLKRHIQQHKKKLGLTPPDEGPKARSRPFYCEICKKQFSQLFKFTVHLQQHASEIPYSCEICKKEFAQHSSLVKHNQSHCDTPHGCDMLIERFVHKVELIRHKLSHTCVNPLCGVCDSRQFYHSMHKRINILRR